MDDNLYSCLIPHNNTTWWQQWGRTDAIKMTGAQCYAIPYSLFTPRCVPLPLHPKVQQELEAMGVIAKVDKPTEWCVEMVVVPKKSGSIRICVNLKPLNTNVLCKVHPLLKVVWSHSVFQVNANSSFWQIPLAKQSQHLTMFIIPYGWYCSKKLPFGISSALEHFQKRISQILEGPPSEFLSWFFGMTNQLEKFSSNLAELTQPLQKLLSKKCLWI